MTNPDKQQQITVHVWRGRENGEFKTCRLPLRQNQTVLDVVTELQRHQLPDLAYRFACRVGVCGSCAMSVNGVPRWTCRTHVQQVLDNHSITIEPLANLPRIKDLVVDLSPFLDSWQSVGAVFEPAATRSDEPARVDPSNAARQAANDAIECINCAVCYAACDTVRWNPDYAGPAALNRAWTLINDERHADREHTLRRAGDRHGCTACHSMGNCTRHCPIGLSPARSIAHLKRATLLGLPAVKYKP